MHTHAALLGVPVGVNEQISAAIAAGELPPWQPGEGYSQTTCTNCQGDMWLGPRQLLALDMAADNHYTILCMPCGMRLIPNLIVTHLGGR